MRDFIRLISGAGVRVVLSFVGSFVRSFVRRITHPCILTYLNTHILTLHLHRDTAPPTAIPRRPQTQRTIHTSHKSPGPKQAVCAAARQGRGLGRITLLLPAPSAPHPRRANNRSRERGGGDGGTTEKPQSPQSASNNTQQQEGGARQAGSREQGAGGLGGAVSSGPRAPRAAPLPQPSARAN